MKICSVAGCGGLHEAKGFCIKHYKRWQRHGSPLAGKYFHGEADAFIEMAVRYKGNDCLDWPFGTAHGYGKITIVGKSRFASRVVCERVHGPAPTPQHESAHSCGRGHLGCITPAHLRWATRSENHADKLLHGTDNRGEKHNLAKLTEAQVLAIRASTDLQHEIAASYGVSKGTIFAIKSGRNWGWLR